MDQPKGGIISKTFYYASRIADMHLGLYAANAGYFIALSVFPALVLILSLLRYTPLDAVDLLNLLKGVLPEALLPAAERLLVNTYAHTSTAMVSVSAIGALWSASRGIYGLLTGLNAIYGVDEDRGYLYTRAISMFYTFLFLLVLLLTLVLSVFGESILQHLIPHKSDWWQLVESVIDFRFILLLVLQTGLFTAMFMAFPNQRNNLRDSLPGALIASCGWLLFSDIFSVYVGYFTDYSSIFGSVYAVALSMLWLYFCLFIVFLGGGINRLMIEHKHSCVGRL